MPGPDVDAPLFLHLARVALVVHDPLRPDDVIGQWPPPGGPVELRLRAGLHRLRRDRGATLQVHLAHRRAVLGQGQQHLRPVVGGQVRRRGAEREGPQRVQVAGVEGDDPAPVGLGHVDDGAAQRVGREVLPDVAEGRRGRRAPDPGRLDPRDAAVVGEGE